MEDRCWRKPPMPEKIHSRRQRNEMVPFTAGKLSKCQGTTQWAQADMPEKSDCVHCLKPSIQMPPQPLLVEFSLGWLKGKKVCRNWQKRLEANVLGTTNNPNYPVVPFYKETIVIATERRLLVFQRYHLCTQKSSLPSSASLCHQLQRVTDERAFSWLNLLPSCALQARRLGKNLALVPSREETVFVPYQSS